MSSRGVSYQGTSLEDSPLTLRGVLGSVRLLIGLFLGAPLVAMERAGPRTQLHHTWGR